MDISEIYAFATLAIVVIMTFADAYRPVRRHVFGVMRSGVVSRPRGSLRTLECRYA